MISSSSQSTSPEPEPHSEASAPVQTEPAPLTRGAGFSSSPPKKTNSRRWGIVGLFVTLVTSSYFYGGSALDGIIWCPFRRLTGLECFGCGMTRASQALVHGDIYQSLAYHPFGILVFAGLGLLAAHNLAELVMRRSISLPGQALWKRHRNVIWTTLLVALVVFGVGRVVW